MPTRIFLFSNKLAPKPPNCTNSIVGMATLRGEARLALAGHFVGHQQQELAVVLFHFAEQGTQAAHKLSPLP